VNDLTNFLLISRPY